MTLFRWTRFPNLAHFVGWLYVIMSMSSTCEASTIPGVYLQLQGGIGGLYTANYKKNSDPYDEVTLRHGLAYRFSAGYLLVQNKLNYGVELGYAGYPKNSYSFNFPSLPANGMQTYKGNTIDLLGVLKLNLNEVVHHDVYLLGKAGVAYVSQTFNGSSTAFDTVFALNKTVRQFEPEVVAGIGYMFNKNFDINLSYHHIFAGSADPVADATVNQNKLTQLSAINLLMAGVAYHFS